MKTVHEELDFPRAMRRASQRARLILQVPRKNGCGMPNRKIRLGFQCSRARNLHHQKQGVAIANTLF